MNCSIQTLRGTRYIIIEDGTEIRQIDVGALASWGALLGITDSGEILEAILNFEEEAPEFGQPNIWTDLYGTLTEGADAMAQAGVPVEHMEDLLDPELGAPVPGRARLDRIAAARAKSRNKISLRSKSGPRTRAADIAISNLKVRVSAELAEEVRGARGAFLDFISPTYELPTPPEPAEELPAEELPAEELPAAAEPTEELPAIAGPTEQDMTNDGTETQSSTGDVPAVAGELAA